MIVGPPVKDLRSASVSARSAVAALRAAPAWPDAPRPAGSEELLPERALDGDARPPGVLVAGVYQPLLAGGSALVDTLTTYLEQGSSLEATARMLFVHPNTVRYRLRRVTELTGFTPSEGRDGLHALDGDHPRPPRGRPALTVRRVVAWPAGATAARSAADGGAGDRCGDPQVRLIVEVLQGLLA